MRILQLNPFPVDRPRHGGQLRAHHTAAVLARAGFDVQRLGIFSSQLYGRSDGPTIDLAAAQTSRRYAHIPQISDYTDGLLLAEDAVCRAAFTRAIGAARPDVLMLENPWLWPAVKHLGAVATGRLKLAYNSYNIESALKKGILRDLGLHDADRIAADIEAVERAVTAAATANSATTLQDMAVLQGWTTHPVVVAPNGTVRRRRGALAGVLPEQVSPDHRYLLYVSSAHQPNASGFADLVLPVLAALRPLERIVVAGGVGTLIRQVIEDRHLTYLARSRMVMLGEVSELCLAALLDNATSVLLPIAYGSGSSLKTAEALYSGHPMVATPVALRGFEAYSDLPNVHVADTPDGFAAAIRRLLDAPPTHRQPSARLDTLLWENTLQPLVTMVGGLADASIAA